LVCGRTTPARSAVRDMNISRPWQGSTAARDPNWGALQGRLCAECTSAPWPGRTRASISEDRRSLAVVCAWSAPAADRSAADRSPSPQPPPTGPARRGGPSVIRAPAR
jgi:hypothetical protein